MNGMHLDRYACGDAIQALRFKVLDPAAARRQMAIIAASLEISLTGKECEVERPFPLYIRVSH